VSAACASAKEALFRLLDGTGRGIEASSATRVRIQEAQLALEAFGGELDLEGTPGLHTLPELLTHTHNTNTRHAFLRLRAHSRCTPLFRALFSLRRPLRVSLRAPTSAGGHLAA
jgi:hypothetical protein